MKLHFVTAFLLVVVLVACAGESGDRQAGANSSGEPNDADDSGDPAYIVFNYAISDREAYGPYLAQVPEILEAYGAEVVIADFESELLEGDAGSVTVVLKFPSEAIARSWYQSPQYQEIIGLRKENSTGIATLAHRAAE